MTLDEELRGALESLAAQGRRRALSSAVSRSPQVDFASNDYLGLARDPEVVASAIDAASSEGAGGRAARLLGGGGDEAIRLEEAAAEWLGTEASLLFPSGYQANLGVVTALIGRGDVAVSDSLVHASLIDGLRLSRADVRVHEHLDVAHVERLLRASRSARRRLVVTEGVFSMDGDRPDLAALIRVCEREDAWLVVDEAHSAGLLGPEGGGACAEVFGRRTPERLVARVITGGKAFGAQGALVAGSEMLRDTLVNRARSFVFTTAPAPMTVAALRSAIARCRRDPALRARPIAMARRLAAALGLPEPAGAIVPVPVGDEGRATELQQVLAEGGFDVRAIRPPTVPAGTCRLRVVCRADHQEVEIDALAEALRACWSRPRSVAIPAPRSESWFVCGTDTGVGKTVVSALLLRALRRLTPPATYWKPVQTGDDDDTAEVGRMAGVAPSDLPPPAFALPLPASPHEAARAAGARITLGEIDGRFSDLCSASARPLVVELAGGLWVPYGDGNFQIDWLAARRPRIVLVARSALGTLNHTLLSVEALRRRGLQPDALFVVGERHPSNLATLRELAGVAATFEVLPFADLDAEALDGWLADHDGLDSLLQR